MGEIAIHFDCAVDLHRIQFLSQFPCIKVVRTPDPRCLKSHVSPSPTATGASWPVGKDPLSLCHNRPAELLQPLPYTRTLTQQPNSSAQVPPPSVSQDQEQVLDPSSAPSSSAMPVTHPSNNNFSPTPFWDSPFPKPWVFSVL